MKELSVQQRFELAKADKYGAIEMGVDKICPGIHFCPDWDGLAVCADSPEANGCSCGRLDGLRGSQIEEDASPMRSEQQGNQSA